MHCLCHTLFSFFGFYLTGKPTIDLETHDIIVIEGEKLSIPVPFRAVPVPTASWHKDGKEVKASDRLTMKSDHISAHLEVLKSVHADAGVYTITLENKLGSATASINVKVIGNHSLMKHWTFFMCWENQLTLQCQYKWLHELAIKKLNVLSDYFLQYEKQEMKLVVKL